MIPLPPQLRSEIPPPLVLDGQAPNHGEKRPNSAHGFEPRPRSWSKTVWDCIFHVFFMAIMAYSNYFYLLPRFLKGESKILYFIKIIPLFVFFIVLLISTKAYIYDDFFNLDTSLFYSKAFIFELSMSSLFIVLVISLFKFVENYVEVEKQKKDIENERLRNELALLKAQINPHFLFNSFNNLYALAVQNSQKTPQVIEQLSQIMRYSLYESSQAEVVLAKEIQLIENIIDLERLHLGEVGNIVFEKKIEEGKSYKIAPMILITFLENAFKHGSKGSATDTIILLKTIDNTLIYNIKNAVDAVPMLTEKSGIGLKNAQRQLELFYPNRHSLHISESETHYEVKLTLKLI
jgi:sensor histidine kinase YesM